MCVNRRTNTNLVGAGSKPARCKISRRYRLPRVGAGFPRPCGIIAGRPTLLHSPSLSFRGGRRPTWESVLFFCVPHRTQRGCGLPRRFAPRNDTGGGIPPGVGYAGQLTTGRHTGRPLPVEPVAAVLPLPFVPVPLVGAGSKPARCGDTIGTGWARGRAADRPARARIGRGRSPGGGEGRELTDPLSHGFAVPAPPEGEPY